MESNATLFIINVIGSSFSFIGSIFILVLFFSRKNLRNYAFKLVTIIAFYDLIRSLCLFIPVYQLEGALMCQIIGVIYYQCILGSILWSLVISISIYQTFILQFFNTERYFICWLVVNFLISINLSLIPIYTHSYTLSIGVCEINTDLSGEIVRFFVTMIPEMFTLITMIYIYIKVGQKIKVSSFADEEKINMERFIIFPIIMAVCIVPALIESILYYFYLDNIYFSCFSACVFSLHGFFNSIFYGITKPVVNELKEIFCKKTFKFRESLVEV